MSLGLLVRVASEVRAIPQAIRARVIFRLSDRDYFRLRDEVMTWMPRAGSELDAAVGADGDVRVLGVLMRMDARTADYADGPPAS